MSFPCDHYLTPSDAAYSRAVSVQALVVKLLVRYPPGFTGAVMRPWLPWGDLLMMRKQFLTLKHLAERQF